MNLREMQERLNALASEMRALNEKGDERTADEESRFDQVIGEFNELGPKVTEAKQRAQERQAAVAEADKYRQGTGSVARKVARDDVRAVDPQDDERDHRSLGERFAASEQVERYRQFGGKRSDPFPVKSFYHRADDGGALQYESLSPEDKRALIYTGDLPASFIQPQYLAGIYRGDDLQGTIRDALINGQTNTDAITFFRETSFTNAAAAVAEATATTGATGLKPESDFQLEEATSTVKTIAHWFAITRQTLDDAAQLRTYAEGRLLDGLRLTESDQLLNGDGTGANLLGLRNTSGVQSLTTAGEFTTTPVADAGSPNENFNRILRARVRSRLTGRARPNFVVLNPEDMEPMLTATNTNGNYYGPGPFSGNGVPNLWGLRVLEDENQPAGEALVGDGRLAIVWDRMQAQILIDTVNDQFIRNMLTMLAEERIALSVLRPAAFVRTELA